MSLTAKDAWKNAEAAMITWLVATSQLGKTIGKNAFKGRRPPGVYDCLAFWLSDGPNPLQAQGHVNRQIRTPSSWWMYGHVDGVFASRDDALSVAGVLMYRLPAGDREGTVIDHIQVVRLTDHMPRVDDLSVEIANRPTGTKQTATLWHIEATLDVVFNNES